jgi:hypothetical protein
MTSQKPETRDQKPEDGNNNRVVPPPGLLSSGFRSGAMRRSGLRCLVSGRPRRILVWTLGFVAGFAIAIAGAETYLRLLPPRFIQKYLGEESTARGRLAPDEAFSYTFRSMEDMVVESGGRGLQLYGFLWAKEFRRMIPKGRLPRVELPGWDVLSFVDSLADELLDCARGSWVILGNSFAADIAGNFTQLTREYFPDRRIVNMGQAGEEWVWHLAQIKTLQENGFGASRCIITLLPVDFLDLGRYELSSRYVTRRGALTYVPRMPAGPPAWFVRHLRLGLAAWVRTGYEMTVPGFEMENVYEEEVPYPETLKRDVERIMRELKRLSDVYGMKITFVLIPSRRQILHGAKFSPQDLIARWCDDLGMGVVDVRDAFQSCPDKPALYLEDRHLSDEGNRIVAEALREHLESGNPND